MPVHEYRFTGVNVIGEPVRGTVFAPHKRAAERLKELNRGQKGGWLYERLGRLFSQMLPAAATQQ